MKGKMEAFWYVDDSVVDMEPTEEILEEVLREYERFGEASGLVANMRKSIIMAQDGTRWHKREKTEIKGKGKP